MENPKRIVVMKCKCGCTNIGAFEAFDKTVYCHACMRGRTDPEILRELPAGQYGWDKITGYYEIPVVEHAQTESLPADWFDDVKV